MEGGSDNLLGARFLTEASGVDACNGNGTGNGTGNSHDRSYRRSAPAPAAAAATVESAALYSEAARTSADGQQLKNVQGGTGDAGFASAVSLPTVEAFYGLDFAFESADISPMRFYRRDEDPRVPNCASISSARNAARASGAEKGN